MPSLPAYTHTLAEPVTHGGQKASVTIAEHKAVIRTLNGRIVSTQKWYATVKKNYGSK